jgi:phenylalanyl-tRNA synthetase alpha chain
MLNKLDALLAEYQNQIVKIEKLPELLKLKADYVGKDGHVTAVLKNLKDAPLDQKKLLGPKGNMVREEIEKLSAKKLEDIEFTEANASLAANKIDLHLRANNMIAGIARGSQHPISIVQREIEDIFLSMGFEILDGPHIEDEFHNFEALNIPSDHPARDMQDTFWFEHPHDASIKNKHLLRTHTSTIQVRGMMSKKPPFRFIAPGKVFRCERTDASHEMVFHQLEGMMVGENISVANLIYFMKTLLTEIFKKNVEVRLRPGFFPFVEPGFELDIKCLICGGKGCSVCKQVGWVELLPCGMVHPNVLKSGGIDPDKFNGFAFGLGLDRLVMMKYGIDDIRLLQSADLRFNQQFKNF